MATRVENTLSNVGELVSRVRSEGGGKVFAQMKVT